MHCECSSVVNFTCDEQQRRRRNDTMGYGG
jgi:hypothetical protein